MPHFLPVVKGSKAYLQAEIGVLTISRVAPKRRDTYFVEFLSRKIGIPQIDGEYEGAAFSRDPDKLHSQGHE
jgi:hypothetical protein